MNKNRGIKSPNANTSYLLSRSKNIFNWIVNGFTMTDIAKKLKVSRSWLFEQFKANEELDNLRKSAYAAREEAINNTLYKLATGNYTTRVVHTQTVTTKSGSDEAKTVTITTEDIYEHSEDPNMSAIGVLSRTMAMRKTNDETRPVISDTITDDDINNFTFCDVAESKDNN